MIEVAIGAEELDALAHDFDRDACPRGISGDRAGRSEAVGPDRPGVGSGRLRADRRVRLVDLDRVAVEVRVGKEAGGALEIHDGEPGLAVVLEDAGATADDLLEGGHGLDALVEDDELAGLGIHAGVQQLGGGDDDRIAAFGQDEVIQLGLALRDRRR